MQSDIVVVITAAVAFDFLIK